MEFQEIAIFTACFIGFISLAKSLITYLKWVWIMFLRSPKNLNEYGSWALITGPTDGIGKALAFELASKGLNLILVGRNPLKLEATSKELRERFGEKVELKSVVVDLARFSGQELANLVEKETKGLDVGLLVNNAGLGYPYPRFFHEVDLELMEGIIKVNLEAATWITLSVLPNMLRKKKGVIINIGSGSTMAIPSYPLYTVYAASKAYLAMFSRCISVEYKNQGIDVQCQIPLFVATKMTKLKATSFLIESPKSYSKASVRSMGYEHLSVPCWSHSVQWLIANCLPDALLNWCVYWYFLGVNKKGKLKEAHLKKLQLQQNKSPIA